MVKSPLFVPRDLALVPLDPPLVPMVPPLVLPLVPPLVPPIVPLESPPPEPPLGSERREKREGAAAGRVTDGIAVGGGE